MPVPRAAGVERRADVVDAIAMLTATLGFPPSVREIGEAAGLRSSQGVQEHLLTLRVDGLVTWEPGAQRTIRLTEAGLAQARIYWPVPTPSTRFLGLVPHTPDQRQLTQEVG